MDISVEKKNVFDIMLLVVKLVSFKEFAYVERCP